MSSQYFRASPTLLFDFDRSGIGGVVSCNFQIFFLYHEIVNKQWKRTPICSNKLTKLVKGNSYPSYSFICHEHCFTKSRRSKLKLIFPLYCLIMGSANQLLTTNMEATEMKIKPMSIQAQACAATEDCGLSKNSQSNVCTRRRKDASICVRKSLLHHHVICGDLSWALPHLFL